MFVAALENDGAGTKPLRRAAQRFLPIPPAFLDLDFKVFGLLESGGVLDQALRAFEDRFQSARADLRVTTDGNACPILVLPSESAEREAFLSDRLVDHTSLNWIGNGRAGRSWREGRLFYSSGYELGE